MTESEEQLPESQPLSWARAMLTALGILFIYGTSAMIVIVVLYRFVVWVGVGVE